MHTEEALPLRERARPEPLAERARTMHTVPVSLSAERVQALAAADRDFLTVGPPAFYRRQGDEYRLDGRPSDLSPDQSFGILRHLGVPNGIRLVRVASLDPAGDTAVLEVHFFNLNALAEIQAAFNADHARARRIFPVSGGHRKPAGAGDGQVQVDSRPAPAAGIAFPDPARPVLHLVLTPIGDYSTYTLRLDGDGLAGLALDPLFAEIRFKFRPRCFNANCAPDFEPAPAPRPQPKIDYLAKDFESFRSTLIAAMMARVPGWQPTSEADLDQTLLELLAVAADELSDFQDRVMNEAYLASARKRVSLARHARLMDYHIHQGNQAGTGLALELAPGAAPFNLEEGFTVWAGRELKDPESAVFVTREARPVHPWLNRIGLYAWSGTVTGLAAGATGADLVALLPTIGSQAGAEEIRDRIRDGRLDRLLIQEHLNPVTGREAGADPSRRQWLRLLPEAEALADPITHAWYVRVRWEERDALTRSYCFTVDCAAPTGRVENVSLFHGNLAEVFHGRLRSQNPAVPLAKTKLIDDRRLLFKEPPAPLLDTNQFHYERTRWGALCRLPSPELAYLDTPPGGEVPPLSTLRVEVAAPGAGTEPWDEVPSLIHSDGDSAHFVVETDEEGYSVIRFGNGVNGKSLPEAAEVLCGYQQGKGLDGNLGADRLVRFDSATPASAPVGTDVAACWNPFDADNGRGPEPAVEIIRRVPEAYRARQLRAVTLDDYRRRAEEVPGVARAAASYAWTGSWRTVRIAIDPLGTDTLEDGLRLAVAHHLETVRLLGEDLEIRPPRFVPLDIVVKLCAAPGYWPEDLKYVLEQEFSDGWTPDGRPGFFHPDRWTFGQGIHVSQILGRVQQVQGVDHVVSLELKRWNDAGAAADQVEGLRPNEIILVRNDPDHRERGFIDFFVGGGRQ